MSKEKILVIIDARLYFEGDSIWSDYGEPTGKSIAPYLVISMLENGEVQCYDVHAFEFVESTEEIAFIRKSDEDICIPFKDIPNRIDSGFLTSDSVFFQNSSLAFAEVYLNALCNFLQSDSDEQRGEYADYTIKYSNFIIRLLNRYLITKCNHYKESLQPVTFELVTNLKKLKDRLFPIINLYQNKRIPNTNSSWILMDEFGNTWESKSPSNHIINDQVSYTISLKNCKENPLFLMFEQGGGESSKKETYLVTYKHFENLIKDREFAYGILSGTRPKEMTPEIYAREMKNLEQIKEKILSLKKESLHRIFTLSSKEIANLKIESF